MLPSPFFLTRSVLRSRRDLAATVSLATSTVLVRSTIAVAAHDAPLQRQQIRTYRQTEQPEDGPPVPSPTATQPEIPPYPFGPRRLYKQSNTGLYGRSRIQFGNTVSRQTEIINPQKNRRQFKPNIQLKQLWSASLGILIRTRVSTNVLRTIDKVGGLDEYLLGSKPARITEMGPWGWRLRWRVMQTPSVQDRFRRQREALGLPADVPAGAEVDAAAAEETQRMIDGDEVFNLTPDESAVSEEEEGFMREAPSRSRS